MHIYKIKQSKKGKQKSFVEVQVQFNLRHEKFDEKY